MLAPVGSVVPIECLRHSATCSHALIMDRDDAEVLCAFAVGGHALALWGGQLQRLAALATWRLRGFTATRLPVMARYAGLAARYAGKRPATRDGHSS